MDHRAAGTRQADDGAGDRDLLVVNFRVALQRILQAQSADQSMHHSAALVDDAGGAQLGFLVDRFQQLAQRLKEPEIAEIAQPGLQVGLAGDGPGPGDDPLDLP